MSNIKHHTCYCGKDLIFEDGQLSNTVCDKCPAKLKAYIFIPKGEKGYYIVKALTEHDARSQYYREVGGAYVFHEPDGVDVGNLPKLNEFTVSYPKEEILGGSPEHYKRKFKRK